jgi:pyruvate dehydrogenase complex dehydrogenase (E1) component
MRYSVLGTDGYGRSDTRANLRRHFEVDRFHVAHAADGRARGGWQAHAEGRRARDQALQAGCGEAESESLFFLPCEAGEGQGGVL